jgi:hypothetical protein
MKSSKAKKMLDNGKPVLEVELYPKKKAILTPQIDKITKL